MGSLSHHTKSQLSKQVPAFWLDVHMVSSISCHLHVTTTTTYFFLKPAPTYIAVCVTVSDLPMTQPNFLDFRRAHVGATRNLT